MLKRVRKIQEADVLRVGYEPAAAALDLGSSARQEADLLSVRYEPLGDKALLFACQREVQQQALGRSHLVVDTAPAHRNDDPAPGVQQQIDLIRPNAQLCVGLPAATGPEAVQFRK